MTSNIASQTTPDEHLLKNTWKVYLQTANEGASDGSQLGEYIDSISSIEYFWGMFDLFEEFTTFPKGTDLYVMKGDNSIKCNYKKVMFEVDASLCKDLYLNILLLTLGESIIHSDKVKGIDLSIRSKYKINVYIDEELNEEERIEVGKMIRAKSSCLPSDFAFKFSCENGFKDYH